MPIENGKKGRKRFSYIDTPVIGNGIYKGMPDDEIAFTMHIAYACSQA